MSSEPDSVDEVGVTGSFTVRMYRFTDIFQKFPGIRCVSDAAKLSVIEELRQNGAIEPLVYETKRNTTCVGLHQSTVDFLDASQPSPAGIDELALGRSATTPTESDTTLNDEVDRSPITTFEDEGDQLRCTVFVDEGEANVDTAAGETISEVGLFLGTKLLNHAVLTNSYEKDETKTLTISVLLKFQAL